MANDYFRFKRFTLWQDRCAMKVGTDGTLLGAWARGGATVLDIGTGTGLIALMMAQRYPAATVTAIDIDAEACRQAAANVAASPFADRVSVVVSSLQSFAAAEEGMPPTTFDSVVCNPPFFTSTLLSPDSRRARSRHAVELTYADLFRHAVRLLADDGELSAVIPFDCRSAFEAEAVINGLSVSRQCAVRTTAGKAPRRYLLAFTMRPPATVEQTELIIGDDSYRSLTVDFYLDGVTEQQRAGTD